MPSHLRDDESSPQSEYLLALGRRLLGPYTTLPTARAAMITGSAAEGVSDFNSDLDMSVYYEGVLPTEEELASIRVANGAPAREWLIGDRADGAIVEAYELAGIQVQIIHVTIAAWEEQMAEVLDRCNSDTPLQKAMSGTLHSVVVAGEERMQQWKARIAAYPDALREAMVRSRLKVFPIWSMPHVATERDASLWHQQMRLEGAFNLLGVLAGLNRQYFSTFQFKKMRRLLSAMTIVPDQCAERLESLMTLPPVEAGEVLETLVPEVLALVAVHLPGVDVTQAGRRVGYRRPAWTYPTRDQREGRT